jgi:hypothetical protein
LVRAVIAETGRMPTEKWLTEKCGHRQTDRLQNNQGSGCRGVHAFIFLPPIFLPIQSVHFSVSPSGDPARLAPAARRSAVARTHRPW